MPHIHARHLALLVVGLLLVSGSAYAAQQLAKNSVGSLQVKNGSLLSKDLKNGSVRGVDLKPGTVTARQVRDGSLRRADLGVTAVADTRVIIRAVEPAAGAVTFFTDPKIGTMTFGCSSGGISTFFSIPATAVPASANVVASDIADNNPAGGATITAPAGTMGGGVGYGGTGHALPQGHFFAVTRTATLHAAWSMSGGGPCTVRMELTVDRTQPSGFFPRTSTAARQATCSATVGAATCRVR